MLRSAAVLFSPKRYPWLHVVHHAVTIGYFNKDDMAHLTYVGRTTYQETYPDFSKEDLDLLFGNFFHQQILGKDLQNPHCVILVMKEADKMFGYAKLYFDQAQPFLDKLYLLQSHQGKGYGRDLLLRCFEECRQRGHNSVRLHAYKENKQALGFYDKFGFRALSEPVSYVNPATGKVMPDSNVALICDDLDKQLSRRCSPSN